MASRVFSDDGILVRATSSTFVLLVAILSAVKAVAHRCVTLSLLFPIGLPLLAQDVNGNLEGRVLDAQGEPLPSVGIVVEGPNLQGMRGTSTDRAGYFRLLALPAGVYSAKLSHVSFQTATLKNIRVYLGNTTRVGDVQLPQESIQFGEIVVTEERLLLDPRSTVVGENLLVREIAELPLDRNYRSVATLLPHSSTSYLGDEVNTAGASGSENRYFINGTDVTDSFRGLTGTNLPYNFIREVQVRSGGYEPEYRSALGGILNVVTYSGGNEFSGQVFAFFTNNNFSSEQQVAAAAPPKGAFSQYDFGFALGGPIIHDELWFFGAYSPYYRSEDIWLPGLGYYPDKIRSNPFAGKLTWRAAQSLDFTATVLGDPTTDNAVAKKFWWWTPPVQMTNPDPLLGKVISGGYGLTLDSRYVGNENMVLQASLFWTSRKNKYGASTHVGSVEPYFFDLETGTLSGGYGENVEITSTAIAGSLTGSANLGSHTVKAGLEYKDIGLDSYNLYSPLLRFNDTSYAAYYVSQNGTVHNRLPSIYVQDSWVLGENFRINGGVRWDGLFLVASNGQVTQRILGQYQPRLGVVFLPGGDESEKVFASAGRYAEDLLTYGSTLYHFGDGYQLILSYNHDPRVNPAGGDTAGYYGGVIQSDVKDLRGQYYDEVSIGYERMIGSKSKFTTRGIFRTLREVIEDGESPPGSGKFYYANPGIPPLSSFPRPIREYLALELSFATSLGESFNVLASYVLSRNYGNYTGLYLQEYGVALPNASPQFDFADILANSTGLLPNDRTHVLKLNGSYRSPFGLNMGISFLWQSGTPLNELGGSTHGLDWATFLRPRGTAGRLPSLWDLNLRLTYDITKLLGSDLRSRLIMDIFHVGNQRTVVMRDQRHYFNQDSQGNQIDQNPTYGQPLRFQPPRSMRLGIEIDF